MCARQGINVPPTNAVAAIQSPTMIGSTQTAKPRPKAANPRVPELSWRAVEGRVEPAVVPSVTGRAKPGSEERRVGKSVDLGGRRIIKKKKKCKRDPEAAPMYQPESHPHSTQSQTTP